MHACRGERHTPFGALAAMLREREARDTAAQAAAAAGSTSGQGGATMPERYFKSGGAGGGGGRAPQLARLVRYSTTACMPCALHPYALHPCVCLMP